MKSIPHIKDIPVSLCRSTMVMRVDGYNPVAPISKQAPLSRRCLHSDPCVRVRLPLPVPESKSIRFGTIEFAGLVMMYSGVFLISATFAWWFLLS
jgi:hypothetical protein